MKRESNSTNADAEQVQRLRATLQNAQQLALSVAFKHEELSLILDSITDGCFVVDRQWHFTYLNASAARFFRRSREEVLETDFWSVVDDLDGVVVKDSLRRAMDHGVTTEIEWYDGTTSTWWEVRAFPTARGLTAYVRDISERKNFVAQLAHQAFHDPLTGLPNRALLFDRLEQALAHAQRHQHAVALFFLDLDDFKRVNDTFGHEIGDALIVQVARRLEKVLRAEDTISRLGGDEFVVMLPDVASIDGAIEVAERMTRIVAEPYQIDMRLITISGSVGGIVSHTLHVPQDLLRQADAAMYVAKSRGKNAYHVVSDTDEVAATSWVADGPEAPTE